MKGGVYDDIRIKLSIAGFAIMNGEDTLLISALFDKTNWYFSTFGIRS